MSDRPSNEHAERSTEPAVALDSERAREILAARTQAAAMMLSGEVVRSEPTLLLSVGRERYLVEARRVRAVAALRRLTALPFAPAHVAGLTLWQGSAVLVLHLRVLLSLPLRALPEYARVVFVGDDGDLVGLIVDAVSDGATLQESEGARAESRAAQDTSTTLTHASASGVARLDLDALLRDPRATLNLHRHTTDTHSES